MIDKDSEKRIARLKEIKSELHDLANSFAGPVTGTAAAEMHGVANELNNCIRMLETGVTEEDTMKLMVRWYSERPELMRLMAGE